MNLNKVLIFGNLTRDPELRQTPSGQSVCSFAVATNRRFKDRSGQRQDQAEFHNIVAWGRLAEIVNQYLRKGSSIFVEGRLQTRSWQDQQGVKHWKTEIIAEQIQLGPRPAGGSGRGYDDGAHHPEESDSNRQGQTGAAPSGMNPEQDSTPIIELPSDESEEIDVKDIPF